mgnify:CR=1 FL=1
MNHPKTAAQINAEHFGHWDNSLSSRKIISVEPSMCGSAPSGSWEFHIWKAGAKQGDKCQCGKYEYK